MDNLCSHALMGEVQAVTAEGGAKCDKHDVLKLSDKGFVIGPLMLMIRVSARPWLTCLALQLSI